MGAPSSKNEILKQYAQRRVASIAKADHVPGYVAGANSEFLEVP